MNVAVLGASTNPERYSYKAILMLREYGHTVFPVHPTLEEVEGIAVFARVEDIDEPLDTVTLYLGPARQSAVADALVAAAPRRVIFNPGTENPELHERLRAAGSEVLEACTLVLLKTGEF